MNKFFVVGCPRSGTTVLQQALNRHSQVVIPPETKFFYYFYGQSRACQLAHLKRINRDLGIHLSPPAHRVTMPSDARAFYDEMASRYVERLDRDGVTFFGDKTPEHTGHLGRIQDVFPNAKIIFVYRDGRDVALSLSRMPWIHCDLYVGLVIWLYYYRVLTRFRPDAPPNMYFVRYEDLVLDPTAELEAILRFLGLPYEAEVARGSGNREGIPEHEYAWKSGALQPITADRVGVWQRELSETQIQKLERLGAGALTDLQYELSGLDRCRLSPWFLARLAWGLARCGFRLPLRCLGNELMGSASRLLSSGRMGERTPVLPEVATRAGARLDVLESDVVT